MRSLSLSNPENSDIKFKISQFPDGQQTVDIDTTSIIEQGMYLTTDHVVIESRMNSFRDIELIICANQALKEMGIPTIDLITPYFLGARSDRKFADGGINYLKSVICPIINSQGFNRVIVLDPHSDVLEACLNNFAKVDNTQLVHFAMETIGKENSVIVSPDAGALKKIYTVAEALEMEDIIIASKHRDIKTGKIVSTTVPLTDEHSDKKFVIIDDICDGGRTFTEIAKVIRQTFADAKIFLIVTHGIFSAGMAPLNEAFDGIFTTNSIRPEDDEQFNLQNDRSKLTIQKLI
jgi:ribose-phosphate pyrophosphokinase